MMGDIFTLCSLSVVFIVLTLTLSPCGLTRVLSGDFPQGRVRNIDHKNIDQLQKELDTWLEFYNTERTHQSKMCCASTPLETLIDGKTASLKNISTEHEMTAQPQRR